MVLIAQRMLDDAFAEDATGVAVLKRLGVEETAHTFKWGEGVSSGVIEIETADDPDYAGTWQSVSTVTFDGSVTPAPKTQTVNVTGHYPVLRHRISTIVTDGTVTSRIDASGDA